MSGNLNTRHVGDVCVVDVVGDLTLGDRAKALRETIRDLLKQDQKRILLNLSGTAYIDSAGISELVASLTTVANAGGKLKLLKPSKRVSDLLRITKIHSVFEIHDDEDAAAQSFRS